MGKAVILDNVPRTSQDIGKQVHNTVANPHSKSHEVAEEIARKHDRHSWNSDLKRTTPDTTSKGEDIGGPGNDGRDEQTPVEKGR